jgi:hypothetical protein
LSPRPAPVAALRAPVAAFGPRGRSVRRVARVPLPTRRATAVMLALASGASALSGLSGATGGVTPAGPPAPGAAEFLPGTGAGWPPTRVDKAGCNPHLNEGEAGHPRRGSVVLSPGFRRPSAGLLRCRHRRLSPGGTTDVGRGRGSLRRPTWPEQIDGIAVRTEVCPTGARKTRSGNR